MAVGAAGTGGAGGSVGAAVKERQPRTPVGRDQQWLLTLLPAFPLMLLVLRLWYLSRQDLETMLLLMQYVSPLGLLSALLITLVWVPPLVILLARALGALLWLSAPSRVEALDSWLVRRSVRMPDWVVTLAVLLAVLTWQLRFLPALVLLTLAIVGLVARDRRPGRRRLVRGVCLVLPLVAAAATYAWVLPAGIEAVRSGETATAVLLLLPPAVAVLLTGPVPAPAARPVTHWTALALALLSPFVLGAVFLRAPVLPTVALELAADPAADSPANPGAGAADPVEPSTPADLATPVDSAGAAGPVDPAAGPTPTAGPATPGDPATPAGGEAAGRPVLTVLRAHVIAVDDRMTILLDADGRVRYVRNDAIVSQTLCPGAEAGPASRVEVRGWHVEQTVLEWLAPPRLSVPADPRCQGRVLRPR